MRAPTRTQTTERRQHRRPHGDVLTLTTGVLRLVSCARYGAEWAEWAGLDDGATSSRRLVGVAGGSGNKNSIMIGVRSFEGGGGGETTTANRRHTQPQPCEYFCVCVCFLCVCEFGEYSKRRNSCSGYSGVARIQAVRVRTVGIDVCE